MADFALTSTMATSIFVLACLSGYQFRRVWKSEGPLWQLWLFGLVAAAGLLTVGFLPLESSG